MKKTILGIIICFLLTLTIGCGREEVTKCKLHTKNDSQNYTVDALYKIYSQEGIVKKIVTIENVLSNDDEVLKNMKEDINKQCATANKENGGYKYNVSIKNNKLTSKVTIDYSKIDMNVLASDNPTLKQYIENGQITTDGIIYIYELMGATCNK